jgi:hypothetical protein
MAVPCEKLRYYDTNEENDQKLRRYWSKFVSPLPAQASHVPIGTPECRCLNPPLFLSRIAAGNLGGHPGNGYLLVA